MSFAMVPNTTLYRCSHVGARWSPTDPEDAPSAARMTLSLANQQRASVRLQDKTMEALYVVRFLATKRNKLKVRNESTRQQHAVYLNAQSAPGHAL